MSKGLIFFEGTAVKNMVVLHIPVHYPGDYPKGYDSGTDKQRLAVLKRAELQLSYRMLFDCEDQLWFGSSTIKI